MAGRFLSRHTWHVARRRVGGWLLRTFGKTAVGWLASTWRTEELGIEQLGRLPKDSGFMIALWHGRMVVGMTAYRGRGWYVLVSESGDGDLSQILLRGFGYGVFRGSPSRGGSRALREMLRALRAGSKIIITPDGPRGPRHSMNPGLAWMARTTGFPVFPLAMVCDRAWHMRSWDRFTIPKPRARVVYSWGEPVTVARDASEEDLAQATETMRENLIALERDAFARLGVEPDW